MTGPPYLTRQPEGWEELAFCHHWLIQPAAGPASIGICHVCGENREFKNYVEDRFWHEFNITSRSAPDAKETVARQAGNHEQTETDEGE